jgi:hypothetical protein
MIDKIQGGTTKFFEEIIPMTTEEWLEKCCKDADEIRVIKTEKGVLALQNKSTNQIFWMKP